MNEEQCKIRFSIFCYVCKHCIGGIFDLTKGEAILVVCEFEDKCEVNQDLMWCPKWEGVELKDFE